MLTRLLSAIVLVPVLCYLVYLGNMPFKISVLIVSIIGLFEFYKAINKKILNINYLGFVFSIIYMLLLDTKFFYLIDIVMVTAILIFLIFMVVDYKNISISDVSITFFGIFYIPVMFSAIYLIRNLEYGFFLVWVPFICAWACDTGAYFVGKSIGKRKLAPNLSPKKTVEGAIGGVISSAIVCGVYGYLIFPILDTMFENKSLLDNILDASEIVPEVVHVFNDKSFLVFSFVLIGVLGA
ncbi:MAG: phosphatidate cytidylyltransferase, partial [bacterium]